MKVTLAAAVLTSAAVGKEAAYAQPAENAYYNDPYNYQAPSNYNSHYGPPANQQQVPAYYGESPYAASDYNAYGGYGHTPDYVEPVYPTKQKPNPFVDYPADEKTGLRLPHFGKYHCFLQGAPWTQCGRHSLTSYFLEQCMSLYYSLSSNVDGICGGAPPAEPAVDPYGSDYDAKPQAAPAAPKYGPTAAPAQDKYAEPTTAPVETTTGYSGATIAVYQKERCLQNAYVSITTAVVMCLTENMIRSKFIEHYAKNAAENPIEGPVLYLRKLHTFIQTVLECNGKAARHNFPNLWTDFHNSDGAETYSPNSPYSVYDNQVSLPQYQNGESSGFTDITVNGLFICNNGADYGHNNGIYRSDAGNPHYSQATFESCRKSAALRVIGVDGALKTCNLFGKAADGDSAGPIGPDGNGYSDMTLRGLYDAVNPVTRKTTSSFRVRSLAEIAVHAGVHGQPILEGFGIMYFCAFYACKANNGGDTEGTCFPEFDGDHDWKIPADVTNVETLNRLGDKVEYCLGKKWLTKEDIAGDHNVKRFQRKLDRSHICMAETHIVRFFNKMTRQTRESGQAWDVVYFRHLATEKCYESENGDCAGRKHLYVHLVKALESLEDTCLNRKSEYKEAAAKHAAYYSNRYQRPVYNAQPVVNRYSN